MTISDSEMRSNEEHGVVAQKGACLTARGCRLALNLGAGALAVNQGSRAGVIGGQVTGNRVGLYAMDKGIVGWTCVRLQGFAAWLDSLSDNFRRLDGRSLLEVDGTSGIWASTSILFYMDITPQFF